MAVTAWQRTDRARLLAVAGSDPYLRWCTDERVIAVTGPSGWGCLHPWRHTGHWGGAFVGRDELDGAVAGSALELLTELAADQGVVPEWFSTDQPQPLRMPGGWESRGSGDWDLMWVEQLAERGPEGVRFVELDDTADAALIESFARRHNPTFEGFPGRGYAQLWLGLCRAGALVAVGSVHVLASGAPHLAGIVVGPDHRGRGIGRALVAELSRRAIDMAGVSTLGVYSDNRVAIALYESLGYQLAHSFRTWTLQPARSLRAC